MPQCRITAGLRGFEALMGYLYLSGNIKRMIDLMKAGLEEK